MPARRPRSRAARRMVGTSPRSSRTIGRTSKMNDFVASSVGWTIAMSWRTSGCAAAGSRAMRRSTICAWSTMFVRLWAGPSCIARAISRRRSSWAVEDHPRDARAARRRRRSSAAAARAPRRPPEAAASALAAGSRAGGSPVPRVGSRSRRVAVACRAPCACPRGRRPGLHHGGTAGQGDELATSRLGDLRRVAACAVSRGAACRPAARAWPRGARPRSGPAGRAARSRRARRRGASSPRRCERVGGSSVAAGVGDWCRARVSAGIAARWVASVNPRASGSSPGASRRRRPGCGR